VCRHLAYVGGPVGVGSLLTDPPHSLVRQSWAPRRQRHGVVNADGFGIGWYVDGLAEPARHRSDRPIWSDETFADLARVLRTTCLLAAVRSATIGMPGGQAAAAPFRMGPYLFSHNGAVNGWPSVAAQLAWGLDPGTMALLEARTDSALLWAMAGDLLARGKSAEAALSGVIAKADAAGGGRLTMLLTDGYRITATTWGTSLCWRQLSGGVVVASEPYDDDPSWVDVPDRSLLVVDPRGVSVEGLG
jgi:gamma-glutamyl hercynylcysteine S-oxide hydrolase